MSVVLAKTALDLNGRDSDPMRACESAIALLKDRVDGLGGVIMAAPDGRVGLQHNTPRMAFAYIEGVLNRRDAAISLR